MHSTPLCNNVCKYTYIHNFAPYGVPHDMHQNKESALATGRDGPVGRMYPAPGCGIMDICTWLAIFWIGMASTELTHTSKPIHTCPEACCTWLQNNALVPLQVIADWEMLMAVWSLPNRANRFTLAKKRVASLQTNALVHSSHCESGYGYDKVTPCYARSRIRIMLKYMNMSVQEIWW